MLTYAGKGLSTEGYGFPLNSDKMYYRYIMRREDPIYQKDLIVKGSDLIKAGMEPGERLGSMLRDMHDEVLRHPEHNSILFLFNKYFYGG